MKRHIDMFIACMNCAFKRDPEAAGVELLETIFPNREEPDYPNPLIAPTIAHEAPIFFKNRIALHTSSVLSPVKEDSDEDEQMIKKLTELQIQFPLLKKMNGNITNA